MSTALSDAAAVKFSRLPKRGVLLGLSVPRLSAAASGVVVFIGALFTGGADATLWAAPLWLLAAALAWTPVAGRHAADWIPLIAAWWSRKAAGQTRYRRRVTTTRPAGTLALPGEAAALRQHVDLETGAVMVHDPHRGTLVAICEVTHPSFLLLDASEQDRRVAAWGRVLSAACRSGRIARLQVLERTLPDSGRGLASWWAERGHDDGSWVARVYRELIDRAGPTGERHVTTVSVALDLRTAARAIRAAGGGMRGSAAVLRQEMATLLTALRAAELNPGPWYTPERLALDLRSAYDPEAAGRLEDAAVGRDPALAGPIGVEEEWGSLRTDSAHHAVLWISEWPQARVYPGFLSPLLLTSGVRRTVSIVYDPVRPDHAAREIRKRKTEYLSDQVQRARMGQLEDARHSAELQDVMQQEADLIAGHGALRYTGLIAVSAADLERLEAATASVEQAAVQSSIDTRRLVGQQAAAFTAAALPLCRGL
jgi:hypothetical protein